MKVYVLFDDIDRSIVEVFATSALAEKYYLSHPPDEREGWGLDEWEVVDRKEAE